MDSEVKKGLTSQVKRLVRTKEYQIDPHAYMDYPDRQIFIDDIIEVLKTGEIEDEAPNTNKDGIEKYTGEQRYVWYGLDIKDRVIRLIIKIKNGLLVISAAHPGEQKAEEMRRKLEE